MLDVVRLSDVFVTVGAPRTIQVVQVNSGLGPFTYSISPALDPGVSLTSNGSIVANPTSDTGGPKTYTLTVTDSTGARGSITFKYDDYTRISMGALDNISVVVGRTVTTSAAPITGGRSPYVFSVSPALDPGVTLNTSNGSITARPTSDTGGPKTYTMTVIDANGATDTNTFIYDEFSS